MNKEKVMKRDDLIEEIAETILNNPMEYNLHDIVYGYLMSKDNRFLQEEYYSVMRKRAFIPYDWKEVKEEGIKIIVEAGIMKEQAVEALMKHGVFPYIVDLLDFLNELLEGVGLKIYSLEGILNAKDRYCVYYIDEVKEERGA